MVTRILAILCLCALAGPRAWGQGQALSISLADSIELTIPPKFGSKPYYSSVQDYAGSTKIWIVDKVSNTVSGYPMDDRGRTVRWTFDPKTAGEVRTFQIQGRKKVLFYTKSSDFSKQIFQYNPISRKITYPEYASKIELAFRNPEAKESWETVYSPSSAPIIFRDGKIVGGLLAYLPPDLTPMLKKKLFFSLDIQSGELQRAPVTFPSAYTTHPINASHQTAYLMEHGTNFITTFAASPELLIWNFEDGILDSFNLEVPGLEMSMPPELDTSISSVQFLLSKGCYGRLFYHPTLQLFLRVVYLPIPYFDRTTGLFRRFEERRACLFIWDKNFVPKQFQMLPEGVDDRNAFCTTSGFAILNPNATTCDSIGKNLIYLNYEISN
jgi:Domain of unknown function (DUF4221)